MSDGEVEAKESCFGRLKRQTETRCGRQNRRFRAFDAHNGKVYTVAIQDTQSATLLPVIHEQVKPDSIVYTDCCKSYNVLDVSGFSHHRINHSKLFADRQNHINGIENFWNQAKRVLRKYNGIDRKSFPLFLKEMRVSF